MCGILGSVVPWGAEPRLDDGALAVQLERLAHRGPDGGGVWREANAVLAHRRLAVRDPSAAGDQPMLSADGRLVLVYNGELYEDAELRAELAALGLPRGGFRSGSDAETVLAAFEAWGAEALARLRGMFALALLDRQTQRLCLARDPLGIKPLYVSCDGRELVFASSPAAVVAHPCVRVAPDLAVVSAYLSNLRTVLGRRTLFEGVEALEPGEVLEVDLRAPRLELRRRGSWRSPPVDTTVGADAAVAQVRAAVEESLRRHLVSDRPLCVLLSGGLDSTILATLAAREVGDLASYAAGAAPAHGAAESGEQDDLGFGRRVAEGLGLRHTAVTVDRAAFAAGWARLIEVQGVPLCTPNEVAILALAERLRADGHVVALGGEGADELFAGYEAVMLAADEFERSRPPGLTPARFQLESTAWVSPAAKAELLTPGVWSATRGDVLLIESYEALFARGADEAGPEAGPVDAHLRFLRRHNLAGLLQRLDTATMLAGVEGRTPFADRALAELAEALPMTHKFDAARARRGERPAGKLVLRRAFTGAIPAAVEAREKASFPLPFQGWLAEHGAALAASPFARALFRREALEVVAADPAAHWSRAWPMMNLARWGDRWWA